MNTFLMFGKYSPQAIREMSRERTQKVVALIQQMGGEVKAMYAVLGDTDLVFVVTLPGIAQAMQASVALTKETGIGFTTCPAVPVEEFDRLVSK